MQELYDRIEINQGLAAERTVLAAERTVLAYVRTAFALIIAGISGAQLVDLLWVRVVAWIVAALGVILFGLGVWRFFRSLGRTRRFVRRGVEEREGRAGR